MKKKTQKTIKETSTGRNIKTIDLKNLSIKENKELIKKADAGELAGYHTTKRKGQAKFLQSNPDRRKKNNLDPIIALPKNKK